MKKALLITMLAAAILFSGCVMELDNEGVAVSDDLMSSSESVDISSDYDQVQAELKLDASKASITANDAKLVEGNFRYNSEKLKPAFEVAGNHISIKSNNPGLNIRKLVSEWDVSITDKLPVYFDVSAAASKVDMDLNGIKVGMLELDIDASTFKVYKDDMNEVSLSSINIDADASTVSLYGIGNLNFGKLMLDADASKLSLDFTGEYAASAEVGITADASTMKLRLPENIGVRIMVDESEVSTIRLGNDHIEKVTNNEYISANYEASSIKLTIVLSLNVTTVTIE